LDKPSKLVQIIQFSRYLNIQIYIWDLCSGVSTVFIWKFDDVDVESEYITLPLIGAYHISIFNVLTLFSNEVSNILL